MKSNKKIIMIIFIVFAFILGNILYLWIIPAINEKECKSRVFPEFEENSEDALRGIVGIIPESEKDGLSIYEGFGSGVIFDKKDNTYYVVTAKHVIDKDNFHFKIFTRDTKFTGETINISKDVDFQIPDEEYYESLLDGKVEYVSDTDDLAILSFQYDGDLTVLEFNKKKLKKNDKIMVIGHPEGNCYKVTYGYIKSGLEITTLKDKRGKLVKEKIVKHNAYMKQGNSGGVALNNDMKIVGINIAGFFNVFRYYNTGLMIPYDIVEDNINNWGGQS